MKNYTNKPALAGLVLLAALAACAAWEMYRVRGPGYVDKPPSQLSWIDVETVRVPGRSNAPRLGVVYEGAVRLIRCGNCPQSHSAWVLPILARRKLKLLVDPTVLHEKFEGPSLLGYPVENRPIEVFQINSGYEIIFVRNINTK